MKLKTLKDFEHPDGINFKAVSVKELKQEAINHIKELKKDSKRLSEKDLSKYPKIPHLDIIRKCPYCNKTILADETIITWIKWFFNISEEELK